MKFPTTGVIFDRKKLSSPMHPGTVEVRVTYNRKNKYFNTGVKVLPKFWNNANQVTGHPDRLLMNAKIDAIHGSIKDYITALALKREEFSFSGLEASMENSRLKESFVKFAEAAKEERSDIQESTRKNHKRLFNFLKEFKNIRTFSDLTKENILKFDNALHKKGFKQTTVFTYHKFLKFYVNLALKRGIIDTSPYAGLRFDRGRSEGRKYLTKEEQDKIRSLVSATPYIEQSKDLFLFQCYTGLAYADLERFDFKKVEKKGQRLILRDTRRKTGTGFHIVLLPEAMEILKKYDFKLPVYSNQKYNQYLKLIAGIAGIGKNLTSHMGRHTFAVNAINSGIPIEVVGRMLGHTNHKTTMIYAKILDPTVEKAFDLMA